VLQEILTGLPTNLPIRFSRTVSSAGQMTPPIYSSHGSQSCTNRRQSTHATEFYLMAN
jgi:hypothetical protein